MIHFLKALLIQEDKQKQHLKRDKDALLECQTQSNPGGTPPRANINVATPSVQPPIALFSLPSELKEKVCTSVADETVLAMLAQTCKFLSTFVEEFRFADGRRINLVGKGMVVNLTAGDGHPVEIMDLTFAIQALCAHHLANDGHSLENRVHLLPKEIDDEVARVKLDAVRMGVDTLTPEQEAFLAGWRE